MLRFWLNDFADRYDIKGPVISPKCVPHLRTSEHIIMCPFLKSDSSLQLEANIGTPAPVSHSLFPSTNQIPLFVVSDVPRVPD